MTDLEIFRKIWNFYMDRRSKDGLSPKKQSLLKDINKLPTKSLNRDLKSNKINDSKAVLVLYASERLVPVNQMEKAISNYMLTKNNSNLNLIFVDVSDGKFLTSQIKILVLKSLLNINFSIFLNGIRKGFASILISCISKWFHQNKIDLICLFSSNSRLIELYRICGIKDNIDQVEFLHGTCTDTFGEYYEILEAYCLYKNVNNDYVNFCPGLPQPPAITNNLLVYDNKQVYFSNERKWEKPLKNKYDALIVGGNTNLGNYIETSFFDMEISAMNDLLNHDLNVVYCPHPRNVKYINEDILPNAVSIKMLYSVIHSAKVIIGGDSSALISAHLLEKNVLIFNEFWNILPKNLAALFKNKEKHTFSVNQTLKIMDQQNENIKLSQEMNTNYLDIMNLNISPQFNVK